MKIDAKLLLAACADDAADAGLVVETTLEPLAGPGAAVRPAVYIGGRYQVDRRWVGSGDDRELAEVVVIDNVPSQANRLEAALEEQASLLGLPAVVLDLSGLGLPPHLPSRLTGFRFPHRQADAYLRDASLDGKPFGSTAVGEALSTATADRPEALFEWFPQALLFGFWQSHLGKKRSQAKLPRSWVSEIVGVRPGSLETRTLGIKGDPLNLSTDERVGYDPDDVTEWDVVEGAKKAGGSKKQESLAEIGHGQVPFRTGEEAPAGVSVREITQRASVSLAGLRRIRCSSAERNAAGRALLVALGIAAHVGAFGRSFSLRSGCDLRAVATRWRWLGADGDVDVDPLTAEAARRLFSDCVGLAEGTGLPVGSSWKGPLTLVPGASLTKVIRATYPPLGGDKVAGS